MTALLSFAAVLISSLGLAYLCFADPKRHRALKSKTEGSSSLFVFLSRLCLIVPPIGLVLMFSDYAALVIWIGATSVVGWSIVNLMRRV
ncbi:MAG: hypothetical protein AAGE89_00045 [Pseudomonadota bacterium]